MRTLLVALATTTLLAAPAFAQGVPISDAQRLTKEVGIANCMRKAASANQSTVSPSQGTTRSLTTPGAAGQSAQVGTQSVAGSAVDGSGAALGVNTTSVGGLDLASLLQVPNSISSLQTGTFAQVLNATDLVATALQSNASTEQQVQGVIGSAQGEQAAFDQNTAARIASASVWNQAIQTANNMLALQTMRLNGELAARAKAATVTSFTPPTSASKGTPGTGSIGLQAPGNSFSPPGLTTAVNPNDTTTADLPDNVIVNGN
ncbi:hypothetical protein GCM10007874_10510 [Labrys miyagiensis]|uniref:Uncharacterized protein n=1 Tax=Labrys miyagiensis TaxID=346912 RepID=A0ABQ6CD23_9HYPH|nr:hypothetical protein [Labrys miyagiensis]GLS18035.1 hypothetical protein GCM10007874_10510 [Labrys miyagiensis]